MTLFQQNLITALNPFSEEAREIVSSSPPLDNMPEDIVELAVRRISWSTGEMRIGQGEDDVRRDVLSFYLMCQGVAAVSYPYSREVRAVSDVTRNTIRYRMYDLFRRGMGDACLEAVRRSINVIGLGEDMRLPGGAEIPRSDIMKIRAIELQEDEVDIADRVADQYSPAYAVRWSDMTPLLKHRRAELVKMYIVGGWVVITLRDLWNIYAGLIAVRTEEYIQSVYERILDSGVPRSSLINVGSRIVSSLPRAPAAAEFVPRFASRRLDPEFFPPCVRAALAGTGSGLRNYAITVLLTSFLSYARLSPPSSAVKITDVTSDISVVSEEIAPLIFEAAERCNPPLFKDQPQEKASIFYHLGFGMVERPTPADSGKSKWYRPPNCSKIQMSAPPLCVPDELCRKVKNPLTYYFRRMAEGRARG
ncbi:MAG: hypothetical protein QXG10_02455 [Candidatus Hadarchaeales archaeon]